MDQPIDGRDGHRRVGEDLIPGAERLVAGHDQTAPLVALGDQLEQDGGLGLVFAGIAEVVEDQAIVAVELGQGCRQRQVPARRLELLDEVGGAGERDPPAGVDQGVADRGGDVRLAGPGRSSDILPGIRTPRGGSSIGSIPGVARSSLSVGATGTAVSRS